MCGLKTHYNLFSVWQSESLFLFFYLNKSPSLAYSIIFRPRRLSAPPPPHPNTSPFTTYSSAYLTLESTHSGWISVRLVVLMTVISSSIIILIIALKKMYASRFSQNLYQRCNTHSGTHNFLVEMNFFLGFSLEPAVTFSFVIKRTRKFDHAFSSLLIWLYFYNNLLYHLIILLD